MIEARAKADSNRNGCEVSVSMEGHGVEIIEEALALIQCVMGGLKDQSIALHMLALQMIADEPTILLGEEKASDLAKDFERFVATTQFKEGVH